jgi:RNA polymerase sigma-70 factor (family 1)
MNLVKELDEPNLLSLLREDSEAAFTEIYNRFWKSLFRTAYHILQDKEASQDIVQNVFVSLWQRRAELRIDNLKGYLHQAARFGVFKAIREQQHDQEFYDRLAQVTADIITDNPLIFKEQQELLRQLIGNLPEDCRETFRLSREENMTYKQIAELLGISEKTVEKRMSRSLQHIRSGLAVGACILILASLH